MILKSIYLLRLLYIGTSEIKEKPEVFKIAFIKIIISFTSFFFVDIPKKFYFNKKYMYKLFPGNKYLILIF